MSIGPKTPYRRKNLADVSYTDRVIAHFASNFVAMATGVGEQKMQLATLHSMAHHRKHPYRRKNLADISYTERIIANFVPNFVAYADPLPVVPHQPNFACGVVSRISFLVSSFIKIG